MIVKNINIITFCRQSPVLPAFHNLVSNPILCVQILCKSQDCPVDGRKLSNLVLIYQKFMSRK